MESKENKIEYLKSIFDLEDDVIHEVLVSTEFCVDKAIDELLTLTANHSVFIDKNQLSYNEEIMQEDNEEGNKELPNDDNIDEERHDVQEIIDNGQNVVQIDEDNENVIDEEAIENVDERNLERKENEDNDVEMDKNGDAEIPSELENEIRARDRVWNATKKLFTYFLPGGDKHEEVGEKIYAVRTNEFGIRHLREIYLTDTFIIRVDPKTRERKEVRSYNDITKLEAQEKKITIHYIDGKDYLTLTQSGVDIFVKFVLDKRPEIEFVNHQ